VTLGSIGWWHDRKRPKGARRHPLIGDRVVIGANATVLGPVSIGSDSVVGAQALVIEDVPSNSRALAPTAVTRGKWGSRPRYLSVVGGDSNAPVPFPSW
jgi:serine O-acetyltransferase